MKLVMVRGEGKGWSRGSRMGDITERTPIANLMADDDRVHWQVDGFQREILEEKAENTRE